MDNASSALSLPQFTDEMFVPVKTRDPVKGSNDTWSSNVHSAAGHVPNLVSPLTLLRFDVFQTMYLAERCIKLNLKKNKKSLSGFMVQKGIR